LASLAYATQSTITGPHVTVSLVAEKTSLRPAKPTWLGVRFQLEKGWHVYWVNPGDSGEPPKVEWKLPAGYQAEALQFPLPRRLPLQTLMNFGYEEDVLYPVIVSVPANAKGAAHVVANVRWMVCKDTCIPGKGTISLNLPVTTESPKPGQLASLFAKTHEELPRKGLKGSVRASSDAFVFRVLAKANAAEFFPLDDLVIENAQPQSFSATSSGFTLTVKKAEQLTKLPTKIRGVLVLDRKRAYVIDFRVGAK
jgi:DsbC/DsbD-like thiol-disulfide interchange protein